MCALLLLVASTGLSCQLEGKGDKVAASNEMDALSNETIAGDRALATMPLDIWPASTQSIFGLDIAKLRRSPMGEVITAGLRSKDLGLLQSLPSSCRHGLVDSIDSMLVIQGFEGSTENVVVAIRGIDRVELEKCSSLTTANTGKRTADDYVVISNDPDNGIVWWLDANTMLHAPTGGKKMIDMARPDASKRRAPTKSTLLQSISRTNTRAAIWMASVPDANGEKNEEFEELRGWADLSDGLNSTWELRYETPAKSKAAATSIEQSRKSFSPFEKYAESLEVRSDGQSLRIRLSLSRALLNDLANESIFKMLVANQSNQ
jgi:hypothetical protein